MRLLKWFCRPKRKRQSPKSAADTTIAASAIDGDGNVYRGHAHVIRLSQPRLSDGSHEYVANHLWSKRVVLLLCGFGVGE
jgi:hypothetical protein